MFDDLIDDVLFHRTTCYFLAEAYNHTVLFVIEK